MINSKEIIRSICQSTIQNKCICIYSVTVVLNMFVNFSHSVYIMLLTRKLICISLIETKTIDRIVWLKVTKHENFVLKFFLNNKSYMVR
jgi:hypothetical protein